ncbi:hypothetical protein Tco_1087478, partial [Tanacetum coccineum]
DILQIFPKVGNKKFEEPPLEKEILTFLASLGHSGEIRNITDVNVNKLHQPWRSFTGIINKCLSGKTSYDSLRLSQAQILWGMYNNKKVDYAYLLWEDFIYQIEKTGKGKQKAKELETISEATLTEAEQLKIKRSRKETHSSHASGSGADEGTGVSPGVSDAPAYDLDDDISWKSSKDDQDSDKDKDDENVKDDDDDAKSGDDQDKDDEAQSESKDDGDDFIHPKLTTHDDETTHEEEADEDDTFDPIVHTPSHVSSSDDEDSNHEVEGVDAIFGQHAEATSQIVILVTAIAEPSFFAQSNPLEDKFSEALYSILGIVDQYLENKLKEAVDVSVQLKYDRIREEAHTENQQFLDSIDEGMKKVIKEQVKKEVS